MTKRKAAKQSAGKARGKAAEKKERAGPSKKSKRAPASKKSAPSGERVASATAHETCPAASMVLHLKVDVTYVNCESAMAERNVEYKHET